MAPRSLAKKAHKVSSPVQIELEDPPGTVQTWIDIDTGIHWVSCDLCRTEIKMTVSANRYNLLMHRNHEICKGNARRLYGNQAQPTRPTPVVPPLAPLNTSTSAMVTAPEVSSIVTPTSTRSSTPRPHYRSHVRHESMTTITTGIAHLGDELPAAAASPPKSTPSVPLRPTEKKQPCPGVSVQWTPGCHWKTYPYIQHGDRSIGWVPISFGAGNFIQFRSDGCPYNIPLNSMTPCISCQVLPSSSKFQKFMAHAAEAPSHTPWEYLSAEQHLKLMKIMAQTSKDLRTELSNAKRSKAVSRRKISEHRRIMMLLATNDIPGLRRMLTMLFKRGASPSAVLSVLKRAAAGGSPVRGGFSTRDMDLSFLAKSLGGPRLLYALQKSHGFASVSTVRRYKKIPRLVPSIGIPTREEMAANISSFLDPEVKPPPQPLASGELPGNVLMFDGIALETKCRYCPDRNAILGLCREHSHRVNTKVDSLESVDQVRIALQKDIKDPGRVCFGSDATVVAIAPYARDDHYTPVPLVVSPSDKTEKGLELAEWLQVLLDTWDSHPQGKALHGRIDALASDGDSACRLAKHKICMVKETDRNSPLGKIVHACVGLNCYTSKDGQCTTCDPKHIFKRDATLLRNESGIMVGSTNILPRDIVDNLSALPDVTTTQAEQLLDPSDKQNVPKATGLIQQLDKVQHLTLTISPTASRTRRAVVFFSKVLSFFVFPFITVEMSLSEQVESLSTYAFLAAALEIKHGSSCFTGPLYYDSQATVKNIIFTIAKMQLLNPNLKFYIILEGTDRLEVVFSDCRTQDHARNFDVDQLAGKLAVGALINAAFQRNPDLDRGHRRLKLSGALGIDHVNPKSWKGNARVGDVDLPKCWAAGLIRANNLLEGYFGPDGRVDFAERFSDGQCDLLRPLGKYVGLDPKHDDQRSERENEDRLFPEATEEPTPDHDQPDEDNRHMSAEQIQSVQNSSTDEDYQDLPLGMDLENFFPDVPLDSDKADSTEAPTAPTAFSKVLAAEGKTYLKSSLVATLSSNRSKKATMRTLRVRGVALEDLRSRKCEQFDPTDLDDDNLLKLGDLVASLVHASGKICLAIFIVKGIKIGSQKSSGRTAISLPDLENPEYKANIVCQLLEMRNPAMQVQPVAPANFWEWTGNYLSLNVSPGKERETRKLFVAEIPGILVHPLGPSVSKPSDLDSSNSEPTWSVPTDQLLEILADAWQSLEPEGKDIAAHIAQLSEVTNPESLPYRNALGQPSLMVENVPEHLTRAKLSAKNKIPCLICGTERRLNQMRHHVASHILKSMRGVSEQVLRPVGIEPCGFCGLDGCSTQLLKHPRKAVTISSSCRYHYARMNYEKAKNAAAQSPSTNVPIHCLLCAVNPVSGNPQTVWKYNAINHIIAEHSLHQNFFPQLPPTFMVEIFIRKEEESALGITQAQTDQWRNVNHIPNSDAVFPDSDLPDSDPPFPQIDKRGRADTTSTTSDISDSDRHRTKRRQ
ncbi:hypothetical protein DFH06DRAFT_1089043 [Mycena polygramma]|nr:hypothetical protein DFH06DRAFT_1089043 [Mycena polygramma]